MFSRLERCMKTTVRQDPPPPSSFNEKPKVPTNPFEKFSILIGKNDFADFTIEAPTFHIEEYFENMGRMSIATSEENAYPRLMKEFYENMAITPRSDGISCLFKNTQITITKDLI